MTTQDESDLRAALIRCGIPDHMHDGVLEYVMRGQYTGGFLTAMLEHNFWRAAGNADHDNAEAFYRWFGFLYNDVPSSCHGSPEKVAAWIMRGGLSGPDPEDAP